MNEVEQISVVEKLLLRGNEIQGSNEAWDSYFDQWKNDCLSFLEETFDGNNEENFYIIFLSGVDHDIYIGIDTLSTCKEYLKLKQKLDYKEEKYGSTVNINIDALTKIIIDMHDKDELITLCHNLHLDVDEFPEQKSSMVREIVKYMNRKKRLKELVVEIFTDKKNEKWVAEFFENCID